MIHSIHQPCYLPWLGLLSKIADSDTLIILDQVQLSDSAYQHRNQFLTNDGKIKYLTIPFVKHNYQRIAFRDIQIADPLWGVSHKNFLVNNYKKHPYFDQVFPELESLFSGKFKYLAEAIITSMTICMDLLAIDTGTILQSQLPYDHELKKDQLVLNLLKASGARHYLSGSGARAYQDDDIFAASGIQLEYARFTHPVYLQKNSAEFIPGLSCLDMLFNIGIENSREVMKSLHNTVMAQ